jgi:hypothetical protein
MSGKSVASAAIINMVPAINFKPDTAHKHLPQCKRCVDNKLPCLLGPGKACWECNQASARCVDWDEDGSPPPRSQRNLFVEDTDDSGRLCLSCLLVRC